MRNLTRSAVIIEHPTGQRTLVEASKQQLERPDLYDEQDAAVLLGPGQRPVRVRKRRQCEAAERERLNADLRRHANEDRDETGDGIVLVEHDVLPLVDHDLRGSVFAPEAAVSKLGISPLVRCLIGAGDLP